MTLDRNYWGTPEKANMARPAYSLNTAKGGTDVIGMTSAALAAAAVALQKASSQVANLYLQKSVTLYAMAQATPGLYQQWIPSGASYPSVSYYDDMAYAAMWLYVATKDPTYLNDAVSFYTQSVSTEGHVSPNPYMWNYENVIPAVDLMLAKYAGSKTNKARVQDFVNVWMNSKKSNIYVYYTPKYLAQAMPQVG